MPTKFQVQRQRKPSGYPVANFTLANAATGKHSTETVKMIGIPSEYLAKMGRYSVNIEGVEVKVKVVGIFSPSVITTHINEMRSSLMKSAGSAPRVVGVDIKNLSTRHDNTYKVIDNKLLVLCTGVNCLIFYLHHDLGRPFSDAKAPEELIQFLGDTSVCCVGSTPGASVLASASSWGVKAGDLAAMVLNKPSLMNSTLPEIAREAGLHYEGPPQGTGESLKVDTINPIVLTEDQVKLAVSNAYYYYKIGHKLLSSL